MAEKTDNLVELIDTLVTQSTFSLDAVKGIEALRVSAAKSQYDLDTYQRMYREKSNEFDQLGTRYNDLIKRATDIEAREKATSALELKVAVAEARAAVYSEVVGKMFGNRILREQALVGHVVPTPQGYPSLHSTSDRKTVEEA